MKVAIVCDWLIGGGAEKVAEQLHIMYPQAPIYTSYCTTEWRQRLDNKVVTGWLQHWPFSRLRKLIPFLRAWWFTRLDLSDFDLVISSSGAEAKFVKVKKPAIHISYIHAPTHYYWSRYDEYLARPGFGVFDPLARLGLRLLVGSLRKLDFRAAQRPSYLIANSNYTKLQIKKYYDRDSVVVHPPIEVEKFKSAKKQKRHGFLVTGRQTPYKRFDLAVAACTRLGLKLIVAGKGPDHESLKRMAGPTVQFTGWVSDEERVKLFQSAEAFIFPPLDDFGISAVEALAAGTPVIAYKAGGALDYIQPHENGLFFEEQSVEGLVKTLTNFSASKFDAATISKSSDRFSSQNFQKNLKSLFKTLKLN